MTFAEAFDVPGSTRFRNHEHDTAHICVVLGGGFMEREKSGWRDVSPGTVRVSAAASHDIDFSGNGATCLVLESISNHLVATVAPRFIENDTRLMALACGIDRASKSSDALRLTRKDDLTTEFLAQVDRRLRGRVSPPPPWLERIREMVHDGTRAASVAELAREAGVHRVHVARSFRDHYGISVSSYARRVRVQGALHLLATSTLSLSQLALQAGFADQSHLTREVRALIGQTPGALRSRLHRFKT
jgi:AraC family transcriptional regulator